MKNRCGMCGINLRPDIAQAIHDAAVSGGFFFLGDIESQILNRVFMSWEDTRLHNGGLEYRTYMLLVAEALS